MARIEKIGADRKNNPREFVLSEKSVLNKRKVQIPNQVRNDVFLTRMARIEMIDTDRKNNPREFVLSEKSVLNKIKV